MNRDFLVEPLTLVEAHNADEALVRQIFGNFREWEWGEDLAAIADSSKLVVSKDGRSIDVEIDKAKIIPSLQSAAALGAKYMI